MSASAAVTMLKYKIAICVGNHYYGSVSVWCFQRMLAMEISVQGPLVIEDSNWFDNYSLLNDWSPKVDQYCVWFYYIKRIIKHKLNKFCFFKVKVILSLYMSQLIDRCYHLLTVINLNRYPLIWTSVGICYVVST